MGKNRNVKDLQQLVEAAGEASTMEWSTISHTHGAADLMDAQNISSDNMAAFNITKQLQQLVEAAGEASTMEWSTISHTHREKEEE